MKSTRRRILLADGNEEVLIALEKLLEDAGFDTTTAWTARAVRTMAASFSFDLALVDEYLPGTEYEEVLKALQERGNRTLCIVMQSRVPENVDFVRLKGLGVKDIVWKSPYQRIVELVKEHFVHDENENLAA